MNAPSSKITDSRVGISIVYPASAFQMAKLRVSYSYRDRLGLDILIVPKPRSGQRAIVFNMELRAFGPAARKHWLEHSDLFATEVRVHPQMSVILGTRKAPRS